MTFLMMEIAWYLLGAAAIGLFIGWAWQSLQAKADEKALELNWRKRYEGERLSLRGVETELEAAAIQLGDMRADHRHAMAKVDNLKIAVEDRDEEIEQLSAAVETARELAVANEALGARLREQETECIRLSQDLEEQLGQTRDKTEKIDALGARLQEQETECIRLSQDLEEQLGQTRDKTEKIDALGARLREQETECVRLSQALEEQLGQTRDKDEKIDALGARLQEQESECVRLSQALEEQLGQTRDKDEKIDALGARLQEQESECVRLSQALEEQLGQTRDKDEKIDALTAANETLAARMEERETRLARLDAEHLEAVDGLRGLSDSSARQEARLAILEAALADRDRRIADLTQAADGLSSERDAALQEQADARSAGEVLERSLEQAAAGLDAVRAESARRQQACRRLEDLDAEHTRRIGELEQHLAQAAALRQRHIAELRSRHEQDLAAARATAHAPASPPPVADARLRDLEARHETAVAGLKSRLQEAQTELARLRRRLTEIDNVATAPVLHKTVSAPPPVEDDLTRISGIGKVLERKLKQLGITRYRDVAMLADEHRREQVASSLGPFRGRITRDNWADQASRLHQAKYGENPDA